MEFEPFPKIARFSREIVITEKIDGTNACIAISEDGSQIIAGSRSRWITPTDDNFGFALWVEQNRDELLKLGPGRHFGEWWGCGIQRNYGLKEKRFSLFNVKRWEDPESRPACCGCVPVLYRSTSFEHVDFAIEYLRSRGSQAAPGFMKPEGVIVYHTASGTLFKKTLEKDDEPKSRAIAA